MSQDAREKFRNLQVVRGGLYAMPRTPEERLRQAVQSRYAKVKNRKGVTPGGPWYDAAEGKTRPLSTLARHIIRAKNAQVSYDEMRRFILGIHEDALAMLDEEYGRRQGPNSPQVA